MFYVTAKGPVPEAKWNSKWLRVLLTGTIICKYDFQAHPYQEDEGSQNNKELSGKNRVCQDIQNPHFSLNVSSKLHHYNHHHQLLQPHRPLRRIVSASNHCFFVENCAYNDVSSNVFSTWVCSDKKILSSTLMLIVMNYLMTQESGSFTNT